MRWWVSVYVIASPVYIAWQYNVHVTSMFRLKYLFTQRPMTIVISALAAAWSCGAIALHVLEFSSEPSIWK